jgi:tetratricopeptide (TPR) repeat protein
MSAIFDKILDWILRTFTGINLIVAIVALLAIAVYWLLSGKKKEERPEFIRRLLPVFGIILVAVLIICIREIFFQSSLFPKGITGILVARIEGDEDNGIQRDLVSTLNTELRKGADLKNVQARALLVLITEAKGHDYARKMGNKCNAKLVIWGSRGSDVRERIIHPRITVITEKYVPAKVASQHFEAQIADELMLPPVLVDRPIFLISFVMAQSYYDQYQFEKAISEFEKCLKQPQADIPDELIQFWLARTYQRLGKYRSKTEYLEKAIKLYQSFFAVLTERDFPVDWAMTQNNLGNAFADLPTGERGENLKQAIACYEKALRIYTERDYPANWAMSQNNLGTVYADLPYGDRGENLKRAIACHEQALQIYTKRDFPVEWAKAQTNLGNAYLALPTGDRGENFKHAIAYYEQALMVLTESDFPVDWAQAQNNLGNVYLALLVGNRSENLQSAIACYEQALRIRSVYDFPTDWAETQNNLGLAYKNLLTGDRGENLKRAIQCFHNALKIWTEEKFPYDYEMANRNLKNAETVLASLKN